jgi:hypothetical protein
MDEDERTAAVAAWACVWCTLADSPMPVIAPADTADVIATLAVIATTAISVAMGGLGEPLRVLRFAERMQAQLMLAELEAVTTPEDLAE